MYQACISRLFGAQYTSPNSVGITYIEIQKNSKFALQQNRV